MRALLSVCLSLGMGITPALACGGPSRPSFNFGKPSLSEPLSGNHIDEDDFERLRLKMMSGVDLSEAETLALARGAGQHGIPYWGADILKRALRAEKTSGTAENFRLLADLNYLARDYIDAFEAYHVSARIEPDSLNYAAWAYTAYKTGQCEKVGIILSNSTLPVKDIAEAWFLIGVCHYSQLPRYASHECWVRDPAQRNARREVYGKALKAFGQVEGIKLFVRRAEYWESYLVEEMESETEDKCVNLEKEQCFLDIKAEYSKPVFTPYLKIEDKCRPYLSEFRSRYTELKREVDFGQN